MNQQVTGSFTNLSEVTGLDRRTVKKLLTGCDPVSSNDKNDTYDLKQLIEALRGTDGNQQSNAKKRMEKAKATLAELDLQKAQDLVVPVDEIEEAWGRLVISVKTNLLAMPNRLMQILGLSKSDRDTIDRELKIILEKLATDEEEFEPSKPSSGKSEKAVGTSTKHKRSRVGRKTQKPVS